MDDKNCLMVLYENYGPLFHEKTILKSPKIVKSMETSFYFLVIHILVSYSLKTKNYNSYTGRFHTKRPRELYECILLVSKDGYKCISGHSRKNQCGNSRFLNQNFSKWSIINKLLLLYISYYNSEYGVLRNSSNGQIQFTTQQKVFNVLSFAVFLLFTRPMVFFSYIYQIVTFYTKLKLEDVSQMLCRKFCRIRRILLRYHTKIFFRKLKTILT